MDCPIIESRHPQYAQVGYYFGMGYSPPANSACPDLIVLHPGSGYLNVFAYQTSLGLKKLLWRERVNCSAGVDLFGELPPLLGRHPLRLETPTALLADPASGGFLLVPGQRQSQRDRAWVERQLQQALPYPPQELHWRTRSGPAQVEIFWLPREWVRSQSDALSRLGLSLKEIYPRASLWREEAGKSVTQQPCLLQEADALHVFDEGLVHRSAPLPADPQAAAQAQQLERLALDTRATGVARKMPGESEEALAERVLKLWLDGSDAIHLADGRWAAWAVWQPALILSAAVAVLVAVTAAGLGTQIARMDTALEGLSRDQRKLAPVERKFAEMESSVRSDRKYVVAARILDKSALPLDALNRVTAALPDKYWVQHLKFTGETLEFSGRGGGNEDVIRLLGRQGIEASAVVSTNAPAPVDQAGADGFNVRLELNKLTGGGAR